MFPGICEIFALSKKLSIFQALGNQNEIKVYAGFLHTHLLGTGVRVHHYRNGQELPYIDSDMNYDFNYQESRFISPEITIKKVNLETKYLQLHCLMHIYM